MRRYVVRVRIFFTAREIPKSGKRFDNYEKRFENDIRNAHTYIYIRHARDRSRRADKTAVYSYIYI